MGRRQGQLLLLAAIAAGTLLVPGCFGVSQNPSYFPRLLPTEDIIRTHARPPGLSYFTNFDPHAVKIEVRPLESTNPVQTHHVLIATVYDEKGVPRRNRRVEWMLEGAGNIVEVDESGYFPGRGYKVDNKYAVSYTDYCEHKVTRGNANPNDDFVIRPGQTWCVITSAVEGDSHMTVYAPEIANWDNNRLVVTKHWVDAEWQLPPPAVNRSGAEHTVTTNVFRHSDHQPLANYRVRYRILAGPPAVFLPSRTQETVAISDLSGNAHATLAQVAAQPGINRIGIEIVRPPDPFTPSGAGIIIGRAETTKEWLAPAIVLTKTGPPTAGMGQEVAYSITVSNNGRVETAGQTLRDPVPEGLQYVRSDPPAVLDVNTLAWTLGPLAAGQVHTVQAVFRAQRLGSVTNCANVVTVEGQRAESCATTQITTPQLAATIAGPAAGVIGVPVTLQINVTNPGTGPATNVVLSAQFDSGFEHESKANPVELKVGTLNAGETRTVPLTLTARQAGRLVTRITATGDGNLSARAEHAMNIQEARLNVTMTGPRLRYVERPALFTIQVVNPTEVPLTNVMVRDPLPPELGFTSASEGGIFRDGEVGWNLGTLSPFDKKVVEVTTKCLKMSPRVVNIATVTADPAVKMQAEAALEIKGMAAFGLKLVDVGDPAEVGGKVTYKIEVINQGTLPGDGVEIIAIAPTQEKVLDADGPSKPRIEGQRVIFPAVDNVQPKQVLSYTVNVEAVQAGDVRFQVELRAKTLSEPVVEQESTTIYVPVPGAGRPTPVPLVPPPGAAPPAPPGQTAPPPAQTTPPPAPGQGPWPLPAPPPPNTTPPPAASSAPPPNASPPPAAPTSGSGNKTDKP
jgi:uncharacterized repeat protein (TIGR01451 family)